jgi:hypothetical protein
MNHYMNKTSKHQLSEFDPLGEFETKCKNLVDPAHVVPGSSFYSHLATVQPKYMGSLFMRFFMTEVTRHLRGYGYQRFYSRSTS